MGSINMFRLFTHQVVPLLKLGNIKTNKSWKRRESNPGEMREHYLFVIPPSAFSLDLSYLSGL